MCPVRFFFLSLLRERVRAQPGKLQFSVTRDRGLRKREREGKKAIQRKNLELPVEKRLRSGRRREAVPSHPHTHRHTPRSFERSLPKFSRYNVAAAASRGSFAADLSACAEIKFSVEVSRRKFLVSDVKALGPLDGHHRAFP